jgi:DNA-binding NarL/FixJ family response regulator
MFEKAADWGSLHRYGFHAAVSKAASLTDIKSTITEVVSRKAPFQDGPVGATPLAPTARQLDLLNAFALDLTGKEIASLLGMSEYRVNEHIAELKRKLNIRSRECLILRAVELGWLEPRVVPMVEMYIAGDERTVSLKS